MGTFLFKWEHPAQEVYVTGTFDDWGKTQKLEKVGSHFEKNVSLAKIDEKIYYKFVVDDNWTTDHTDPQETDSSGNTNNVLHPEDIKKDAVASDGGSSDLPGAFPETPFVENTSFGISPLPASSGAGNPISTRPGEELPIQTKSVEDHVTLDKASYDNAGSGTLPESSEAEEQSFSVNPLPASASIGNPVSTRPGEDLPIQTKSINDHVTLDQASYENSGSGIPQLPDVVTPERERSQKGGMFGLDTTPGAGTEIPESGLAIGAGAGLGAAALAASGPHISSVGPQATTVDLAGQVPLEPREGDANISSVGPQSTTTQLAGQVPLESTSEVPDVVEKSQEAAHVSPEASANPEAVHEKSAVEAELTSKVPEAPATSDNSISGKAIAIGSGVAATATAAVAGAAAYVSSGKATEDVKSSLPVAAQEKIEDLTKSSGATSNESAANGTAIASTVPDTVQESIAKAHESPEAAANPEAVQEKSAVESELLEKTTSGTSGTAIAPAVPDAVQESITEAHQSPEAAANPEAVEEKSAVESELLKKVSHVESESLEKTTSGTSSTAIAPAVPDAVQESITETHQSPEAAANPEAVEEKSAVESELLKTVSPVESAGAPAPTASAATTATAPQATTESTSSPADTQKSSSGITGAAVGGAAAFSAATGAALAAITGQSKSESSKDVSTTAAPTPAKSSTPTTTGLAAPASSQAQSDATAAKSASAVSDSLAAPAQSTPGRDTTRRAVDSRDVSPMTRTPADSSAPIVTTGVASAKTETTTPAPVSTPKKTTTPAAISTPTAAVASSSSATPASPVSATKTGESPATDKKSKRKSGFFGRLKEKLHSKDKN